MLNSSPPLTLFPQPQSCSSVFGSIAASTTVLPVWRMRTGTSEGEHSARSLSLRTLGVLHDRHERQRQHTQDRHRRHYHLSILNSSSSNIISSRVLRPQLPRILRVLRKMHLHPLRRAD